jgi:putative thioredoxin
MSWLKFWKKDAAERRLAIIDVGDSDFKQQVIQRSFKTTVVVDYWAAWCGPCRQLGPVLEKIAEEPDSEFILAKLDTERNQQTAAKFNIYSIPAVKAFRNGQVVNEFTGALPEPLVRRFLSKVTSEPPPTPQMRGSSDSKRLLRQAEQHLKKGRGFEAYVLLNEFPESPQKERADSLLPLARFLFDMGDGDGLTGSETLDEEYLAAAGAMRKRKPVLALDHLFAALEVGEDFDRSYTIEVIESLFALLGEESQTVKEYRNRLPVSEA